MTRYALMFVLFVLAVGVPARFGGTAAPAHDPGSGEVAADAAYADGVPEAVREAADRGRYWRASRLMATYLATIPDTSAATVLLAARLSAGWGDWDHVSLLLEGRDWLDSVDRGAGWELLGRSRVALGNPSEGAQALGRYLERHRGTDHDAGVAELRRGLAHAAADEHAAALEAFHRARRFLPWFEDWGALIGAEAAAAAGDTAVVRSLVAEAGPIAEGRAWRLRVRATLSAGDSMAAREAAHAAARSATSAADRAAAWSELGSLRLRAGDTVRAREAFVRAMEQPETIAAIDAARQLSDLDPAPAEWRAIADIYARHGNANRAAQGYAEYLAGNAASATDRTEVRLRLGRARYNAGQFAVAERELLALASERVAPEVGAEALYLAGRAQYRQGRGAEGQRTLARLPERFPGQAAVTRGLYLLADLKHDDLELDDARRYYRLAAETRPGLNEAGLSLMRLGGMAMLEEDYASALEVFEDYRSAHPEGRRWGQATYWSALAYEAAGQAELGRERLREIRSVEPFSYYGVQAATLLGEPVLAVPMVAPPATDSATDRRVREGMRRVEVLAALERRDDLVQEVERLRAELTGKAGQYALAEALNEGGYTLTAIGIGWALYRGDREWNERLLRIIYPFPFRDLVVPESRERGLDPYLVAGIIRRESAFNPTVRSGAGAIGLMQIMPATGRTLARAAGLRDFEPGLLTQPEVNTHLGTWYFAEMLDRFDHHLPLVLSAYNAGPTRAARWRELPEANSPELFTERIPYSETRDYVRNVLLHRALYRELYPALVTDGTGPGAGSPDAP